MVVVTYGAVPLGAGAEVVRVEVTLRRGIPCFEIVGLGDTSVRESRVRVRAALSELGVELGEQRVVVSLAPADLRKGGAGLDLPIAVGIAAACGFAPPEPLGDTMFVGELSLSAELRRVRGILPCVCAGATRGRIRRVIVPEGAGPESALVRAVDVRVARSLGDVIRALRGAHVLPRAEAAPAEPLSECIDLADVSGQALGKRALEVAAAGGHHLLLMGAPGVGKTMLARRLPGLLPPLTDEEALEVLCVESVARSDEGGRPAVSCARPFRAPHHNTSEVALVGGGGVPRPGEISRAHHGVLFLDECGEFRRSALQALRQPLEDGYVLVTRRAGTVRFPARAQLVCAMNPCPCGYLGAPGARCACSPDAIFAYRARVSGPLLERIDLHVVLSPEGRQQSGGGDTTVRVKERVLRARAFRNDRVRERSPRALSSGSARLLDKVGERLRYSPRSFDRVMNVARTLADLSHSLTIEEPHVAEALALRALDRSPFSL